MALALRSSLKLALDTSPELDFFVRPLCRHARLAPAFLGPSFSPPSRLSGGVALVLGPRHVSRAEKQAYVPGA